MPLLDHFHPPLSPLRYWQSFLGSWAVTITSDLNLRLLPVGWFASPNFQVGLELSEYNWDENQAEARSGWVPPDPTACIHFVIGTDMVEVFVYDERNAVQPKLAGAIKLLCPQNKERRAGRDVFLSRCEVHLHDRQGLMIVDNVTDPLGRVHDSLMERLGQVPLPQTSDLVAAAYWPFGIQDKERLDVWVESVDIGGLLPTLPLCLTGGLCVPVDFEATYQHACKMLKMHEI